MLTSAGYGQAASAEGATIILVNTCAIRENAEAKVGGCLLGVHATIRAHRQSTSCAVCQLCWACTQLHAASGAGAGVLPGCVAGAGLCRWSVAGLLVGGGQGLLVGAGQGLQQAEGWHAASPPVRCCRSGSGWDISRT